MGYYRQFILRYAVLARPLTALLKEDVTWRWSKEQQRAFDDLKQRLQSAPVLALPTPDRPFVLYTDFCGVAVSAVLE